MNRKKFYFSCVAIVVSVLLTFCAFEIFLRFFGPEWLQVRMQEVGVQNITGVSADSFGSDKDWPVVRIKGKFIKFVPLSRMRIQHYEYDVEASIDEWGGRFVNPSPEQKNKKPIPVLGDSFTFGIGVQDKETFVSLLTQKLPYHFINLGIPGSTLSQQFDVVSMRHKELQAPRAYIFSFFTGNDFTNFLTNILPKGANDHSADLSRLRASSFTKFLEGINDFVRQNELLRKIYVIQFVKAKLLMIYNNYRVSKGIIRRMDDEIFYVIRPSQDFEKMVALLDEELRRISQLASELKFRPIFIIIPDRHQVDAKLYNSKLKYYGLSASEVDIDLPNKVLRKKFSSYGLTFIDPIHCLRKKNDESKKNKLYFTLDNHLTPKGHEALSECIVVEIDKALSPL